MRKIIVFSYLLVITACDHVKKMKEDADSSRKKSDSLLNEFKKIDRALDSGRKIYDSFLKPTPGF